MVFLSNVGNIFKLKYLVVNNEKVISIDLWKLILLVYVLVKIGSKYNLLEKRLEIIFVLKLLKFKIVDK